MADEDHVAAVTAIEGRLSAVEKTVEKMNGKLDSISDNVIQLMATSGHTEEHCPYRVEISMATNGANRSGLRAEKAVTLAEKAMDLTVQNRVDIARLVATAAAGGGSIGGLIGAAVAFALSTM